MWPVLPFATALIITAFLASPKAAAQGGGLAAPACGVTVVSSPAPSLPRSDNQTTTALQAPVVELSIAEDGTVAKAKLARTSNINAWDKAILTKVKTWRFSKAPGCGIRKTTVSVDIDMR